MRSYYRFLSKNDACRNAKVSLLGSPDRMSNENSSHRAMVKSIMLYLALRFSFRPLISLSHVLTLARKSLGKHRFPMRQFEFIKEGYGSDQRKSQCLTRGHTCVKSR